MIEELGGTVDGGMNWTWANEIPTKENADKLFEYIKENGYDHRGIYTDDGTWSIRFR